MPKPAKRTWQEVRDIVETQLLAEGQDPYALNAQSIEYMGEQGFWEHYMKSENCAERLAAHASTNV